MHVLDASRAVDVVSRLLERSEARRLRRERTADQERLRAAVRRAEAAAAAAVAEAQRKPAASWIGRRRRSRCRRSPARRLVDVRSTTIVPYIDWTFFFAAWELKGRFPAILEHPKYGAAARELYEHARALLDRIVTERLAPRTGVYGFWPANTDGDDIVVFDPDGESAIDATNYSLQHAAPAGADRPTASRICRWPTSSRRARAGSSDYLGAFAVTAGIGADELVARYEADHDDYHAIMVKALADRLAEAFAEVAARTGATGWGYGADEQLTQRRSDARKVSRHPSGVRLSGLPRSQREAEAVSTCLEPNAPASALTESCAMTPAASVSGLYFAHPQAPLFSVGRIGRDQVEDYAANGRVRPAARRSRTLARAGNLGCGP